MQSKTIIKMWDDKKNAGGPITNSLSSKTSIKILTPNITSYIDHKKRQNILGFYSIKKIKRSKKFSKGYFDIDILLIAPDHWTSDQRTMV